MNNYKLVYISDNNKIENNLKDLKAPYSYNLNLKNYYYKYYKSFSIQDFSFFLYKDDRLLAFIPIHISKNDNNIISISIADTPVLSPIFSKYVLEDNSKIILDRIFQEIDKIIKNNNVSYSVFEISPFLYLNCDLSKTDFYKNYGFVENYHFNDWYIYACDNATIIDLSLPLSEISENFNHNRRNEIKKDIDEILILDSENILTHENIFSKFCIYKSKLKKISMEIVNEEKNLIINNNQVLSIKLDQNKEIVSYSGIFLDNSYSYQNSAGGGKITKNLWEIIKYLKNKRLLYFWISERLKKDLVISVVNKPKFFGLDRFAQSFGKNNLYPWKKFFKC
jgi:hypothetical protein